MRQPKRFVFGLVLSQATLLLAVLLWLLQSSIAHAANLNVNTFSDLSDGNCNDGTCSLRDAVALATPGDSVNLPAGTYLLSSGLGQISIAKNITIAGQGATASSTVIDGNNAIRLFEISGGTITFSNLTLQNGQPASGDGGAILVSAYAELTLDNVIVQDSETVGFGGGVYMEDGVLDILNGSQILSNTAVTDPSAAGGAIYLFDGTMNLVDSTVANNQATYAGGIRLNQNSSSLTITNSQLINNSGLELNVFTGGAIHTGLGTVIMNSGLISGNTAFRGAGVLVDNGKFTLNGGTITDNESDYGAGAYVVYSNALLTINGGSISGNRSIATKFGGGGMYIFQGSVVQNGGEISGNTAVNLGGAMEVRQGSFTMNGGSIANNSAGNQGGGIFNDLGTVTLTDGTLTGNYAEFGGGAIATGVDSHIEISRTVIYTNSTHSSENGGGILNLGTITLTNVTLSDNLANNGGGLHNEGSATLNNVTIYENTAVSSGGGIYENGGTLTVGNTIIAGNSAPAGPDCTGTLTSSGYNLLQASSGCTVSGSTTGNISGDPLLAALALNGGSTLNHLPNSGSPAIDAGNNATCAATDQRSVARPLDGDGNTSAICDMGAVEYGTGTPPTPSLNIADSSVSEGNSGTKTATFTVTLSAASAATVQVNYTTANGTAVANTDYQFSSGTLTFTPGDTEELITITINGDTTDEDNETFQVNLSGASNATIADGQATGTITDDDSVPTLSISDPTVTEGNSGTRQISFNLSLDHPSSKTITVDYATQANSATAGSDFTAKSGTATFVASDTEETVQITILGDTIDEDNETFFLNLSNATNVSLPDSQGQATITDDDAPPTISVANVTLTEGDSGTQTAVFTVALSQASSKIITVNVATSNGTATAGEDYTAVPLTTLTFNPGASLSQTVAVTIQGDTVTEGNETFQLSLSSPSNATLGTSQATGTITDNDGVFVYLPFIINP